MIDVLVGIELTLAAVCLGRFAWGMTRAFSWPDGVKSYMVAAGACGSVSGVINAVALLWFNQRPLVGTLSAIPLYTIAWLMFESAVLATRSQQLSFAFSSDLPSRLLHRGPYRLVRHPFYASYLLAWFAGFCATGQPLLLLPLAVMFCIYNRAANLEEAKFASSPLAADYAEYRKHTGKYLPRLRQLIAGA